MSRLRLVLLFSCIIIFSSWGFLVHRTVHQLAVYELPGDIRPFFYANIKYLVENAGRPDQRRNQDSTEAPKHFIDLEAFGDSAAWKMPFGWEEAVKIYTKDSLLEYGHVPYHIITMKNKLTAAFRSGNKDSILFYATDLAHYIGDANVPLHNSLNYDGQLSNQNGLHSLWESMIPELEIEQYNLYSRHKASYLANPEQKIWDCIRRAHKMLPDVFGKEIEATKGFTDSTKFRVQMRRGKEVRSFTPAFAKAYNLLLGQSINDQLLNSANMIADFWYTAWVDAGKPDLSAISPMSPGVTKSTLKGELKAWKRNELIKKSLLLSKKQPPQTQP
ncbi:MAG TPA: zinc dependent phospholipase C family protein [Chitinophagaceae bacterium]|nr:zinc dependent phospholipase C family protein [Chitinophagaceae bacterium]